MSGPGQGAAVADTNLAAALVLSRDTVIAADRGDLITIAQLDAERRRLLESYRARTAHIRPLDRSLLDEIARLNDQALGLMEHHRRIKSRALDVANVGRRAVAAYGSHRKTWLG